MTPEELAQKAGAVPVTEFVAKKVKIATTDAEGEFLEFLRHKIKKRLTGLTKWCNFFRIL